MGKNNTKEHIVGSGSCSALIKLLPDNKELYVAHDMWDKYILMIRIFKYYDLPYATSSSNCEYKFLGDASGTLSVLVSPK